MYTVDPLKDPRWPTFLSRHSRSSVFHTKAWLEALHRTYQYEPVALTTSPPGTDLHNGLVLCRVQSWLTGSRLVSLPFSDHCDPLLDNSEDAAAILSVLQRDLSLHHLRYVEIRPKVALGASAPQFRSTRAYCLHQLDLRPDINTLFRNLHKDSTQRKIKRAQRESVTCEAGRSDSLLANFCQLLLLTRRRHKVPPQPVQWFRNLIDCFGEALNISVAFKDGRPLAAILTIRCKDTLVFKYGCSDTHYNTLGGMHLLLWNSMEEAKHAGIDTFDLGRSDCDNAGPPPLQRPVERREVDIDLLAPYTHPFPSRTFTIHQ